MGQVSWGSEAPGRPSGPDPAFTDPHVAAKNSACSKCLHEELNFNLIRQILRVV